MDDQYEKCPHCGQTLLRGALKCINCGKILKTPEAQFADIERLRKSKKSQSGFNFASFLKCVLYLVIIAAVYYYFGDDILEYLQRFTG